jgi:hypothetical protein
MTTPLERRPHSKVTSVADRGNGAPQVTKSAVDAMLLSAKVAAPRYLVRCERPPSRAPSCRFRDHFAELKALGVNHLFGVKRLGLEEPRPLGDAPAARAAATLSHDGFATSRTQRDVRFLLASSQDEKRLSGAGSEILIPRRTSRVSPDQRRSGDENRLYVDEFADAKFR